MLPSYTYLRNMVISYNNGTLFVTDETVTNVSVRLSISIIPLTFIFIEWTSFFSSLNEYTTLIDTTFTLNTVLLSLFNFENRLYVPLSRSKIRGLLAEMRLFGFSFLVVHAVTCQLKVIVSFCYDWFNLINPTVSLSAWVYATRCNLRFVFHALAVFVCLLCSSMTYVGMPAWMALCMGLRV